MMNTDHIKKRNLLLAITLFTVSMGFAQIKFDERSLSFLQTIAYGSAYENIVTSFQNFNVPLDSRIENDDKSELLTFKMNAEKKISILYSKDKELIYACIEFGPENNENSSFIEMELSLHKDFEYKSFKTRSIGGRLVSTFKRNDYQYEFVLIHELKYADVEEQKLQKFYMIHKDFPKVREAITTP